MRRFTAGEGLRVFVLALAVGGGSSCGGLDTADTEGREDAAESEAEAPSVGRTSVASPAPFDLSEVMRRAPLAFRPSADGFAGGRGVYRSEVIDQTCSITAVHPEDESVATLEVETVDVRRGGHPLALSEPIATVTKEGDIEIDRGPVVEVLENTETGVEQRWAVAEAPTGKGDLVFEVRVAGLPYVGATEHGLHFADPETELGLRYGAATWIDGAGARHTVPIEYDGGTIEIRVPASVVATSVYPAVLDPIIGPEIGTDQPIVGPGAGNDYSPAIASNGTDYLVVWSDLTNLSTDIFGARVSSAGVVLDSTAFPIAHGESRQEAAAVVFDGQNYVVAWQTVASEYDLAMTRVGVDGVVLEPNGVPLSTANLNQEWVALASDGTRAFAVWQDSRSGGAPDVYGTVIENGVPLSPNGIIISNAAAAQIKPQVAFADGQFVAAWTDGRSGANGAIYGSRVASNGAVVDPTGIPLVPVASYAIGQRVALATNGTNLLLSWTTPGTIQSRRFDPATLQPIDAGPVSIDSSAAVNPSVAASNGDYLVTWTRDLSQRDVRTRWISGETGAPLDSVEIASATGQGCQTSSVGSSSGGAFVAWGGCGAIKGRDYPGPAQTPGQPVVIAHAANGQWTPAADFDGSQWLVVWTDGRAGSDTYGVRVDRDGTVLDPLAIAIEMGVAASGEPTVSHDSANFLVAWSHREPGLESDIYGARVSRATGALVDPVPSSLAAPFGYQQAPRLAFDGSNYLLTFVTYGGGVSLTRVSPDGQALDLPPLGQSGMGATHDLIFDGTQYVIAGLNGSDLRIARVSTAGALLDPGGIPVSFPTFPGTTRRKIAIASDGDGGYYVLSGEYNTSGTVAKVRGVRLAANFASFGSIVELAAQVFTETVDLDFDGYHYVATWLADNGTSVAWISTSGSPLGPAVIIASTPTFSGRSVVSSAGDGASLVAYSRFEANPPYAQDRVFSRIVQFGSPIATTCSLDSECVSNFCVDGVCCDSQCGQGNLTDCQACSVAAGAPADGTCVNVSGVECRTASDLCDVAEVCDGTSPTCPTDALAAPTVECRPANGSCDAAESCSGVSAACPSDGYAPTSTECRAAADICDTAEFCSGSGSECPSDLVANAGVVCRVAAGDCDLAESCDGSGVSCPGDSFTAQGTSCRPATDLCDAVESCTGTAPECPLDAVLAGGTSCRAASGECDVEDFCDGTAAACADNGEVADAPCGAPPAGDCDVQDSCSGGPGAQNECIDRVRGATFTCRAANGDCDVAEACTATGHACPSDGFASSGVCRDAASSCDAAESCDGSSAQCPADGELPDGTQCDDASICEDGACVPDEANGGGAATGGGSPEGGSAAEGGGGGAVDGGGDANGGGSADDTGEDGCSCSTVAPTSDRRSTVGLFLLTALLLAKRKRAADRSKRSGGVAAS